MSSRLFVRRWALAIAVLAAGALASAATASAAADPLIWGAPVPYQTVDLSDPTATLSLLSSIACPSNGNCVAVGYSEPVGGAEADPVFAVESGGAWGSPDLVTQLPMDAGSAELLSVSCASATACVAVGSYQNSGGGTDPMVVPISLGGGTGVAGAATIVTPPGTESDDAQVAALDSVSCGPAGCEAVGQYLDGTGDPEAMLAVAGADGTWSASSVPAPSPAAGDESLTSISCPSNGGACEAVGNYANESDQFYPWAVQISDGTAGAGQNITMPADFSPEGEGGILPFLPENGATEVSCPSASACTAAGSYVNTAGISDGYAVPIANGIPGTVVDVSSAPSTGVGLSVDGLSCADADDCLLTGATLDIGTGATSGFYGTETAGTWAPSTTFGAGPESSVVISLGCSSATNCEAFGEGANGTEPGTFFISSAAPLSVASSPLPAATVGVPYSATLRATGGSRTNTWSVSVGALPDGLTLDRATGVISGVPTDAGKDGFVVTDSDPGPPAQTATGGLSIDVATAPTTTPPPSTTVTVPTTVTVTTTSPVTSTPVTTTPPATVAAAAVAKLTKVSAKGTSVSATVSCSGAACKGSLALTTVEHLTGTKVTEITARAKAGAAGKTKPKTKTITLAKGSYSMAAGESKTVTLTLKDAAAKLLTSRHTLLAKLALTPSGSKKAPSPRTVVLKATAKKK